MIDDLQFDKAEYEHAAPVCAACRLPVEGPSFLLGARSVCAACKEAIVASLGAPIGAVGYAKALGAGAAAGIACAIAWAIIRAATGYDLSIVAIGVGWAVAEAMRWGAGRGTRALQVAAVAVTYLAIVESSVPALAPEMELGGGILGLVASWAIASVVVLAMPLFVWSAGGSSVFWYLIAAIGMHRAWAGLTPPRLDFVGPVPAARPR